MATPDWIGPNQQIVGQSHPTLIDTKNSCGQTIQLMIEVEHDSNGRHNAQDYALIGEIDTYSGDGSSSKTITLSNSTLTPKLCVIWKDAVSYTLDKVDVMTSDLAMYRGGISRLNALTFATGSFTVTAAAYLSNGVTFYYMVLGIDNTGTYTGDSGAGSDPTWMTSGNLSTAPMIGSDDNTVSQVLNSANSVESEIWTQFIKEHNADGTHSTDPYSGCTKIETGMYEGDATDNRDITMTYNIDIQYLIVIVDTGAASTARSRSETMAGDNTKDERTAAFVVNNIQSIGTGTFQVGTGINAASVDYYYCAIGV